MIDLPFVAFHGHCHGCVTQYLRGIVGGCGECQFGPGIGAGRPDLKEKGLRDRERQLLEDTTLVWNTQKDWDK